MTFFIRSRMERQADRDWCDQYMEHDAFEECGHGVVRAVLIGVGIWLVVAAVVGWLD